MASYSVVGDTGKPDQNGKTGSFSVPPELQKQIKDSEELVGRLEREQVYAAMQTAQQRAQSLQTWLKNAKRTALLLDEQVKKEGKDVKKVEKKGIGSLFRTKNQQAALEAKELGELSVAIERRDAHLAQMSDVERQLNGTTREIEELQVKIVQLQSAQQFLAQYSPSAPKGPFVAPGTPVAPAGYHGGAPAGADTRHYGAPAGYPPPPGYGAPPPGYGAPMGHQGGPAGYGHPPPGYGAPAGYGPTPGYGGYPGQAYPPAPVHHHHHQQHGHHHGGMGAGAGVGLGVAGGLLGGMMLGSLLTPGYDQVTNNYYGEEGGGDMGGDMGGGE